MEEATKIYLENLIKDTFSKQIELLNDNILLCENVTTYVSTTNDMIFMDNVCNIELQGDLLIITCDKTDDNTAYTQEIVYKIWYKDIKYIDIDYKGITFYKYNFETIQELMFDTYE